jgi:uncharacterized protein (DUF1810 family)
MATPFDLDRFIEAQDRIYDDVRAELTAGAKASHWMWFVFPQLQGLGRSTMAIKYGITDKEETQAYWQHDVLGSRLEECVELVLAVKGKTAFQIFGTPDDLKFRSSMTLFAQAVPDEPMFKRALAKYFDGREDLKTTELLARP